MDGNFFVKLKQMERDILAEKGDAEGLAVLASMEDEAENNSEDLQVKPEKSAAIAEKTEPGSK